MDGLSSFHGASCPRKKNEIGFEVESETRADGDEIVHLGTMKGGGMDVVLMLVAMPGAMDGQTDPKEARSRW